MAEKEIEVFETTAEQVADVLRRLGVPKERMVTVTIEPEDWLTKARQESRRLVVAAGLSAFRCKSIQFVNEDDTRRSPLRLLENTAQA